MGAFTRKDVSMKKEKVSWFCLSFKLWPPWGSRSSIKMIDCITRSTQRERSTNVLRAVITFSKAAAAKVNHVLSCPLILKYTKLMYCYQLFKCRTRLWKSYIQEHLNAVKLCLKGKLSFILLSLYLKWNIRSFLAYSSWKTEIQCLRLLEYFIQLIYILSTWLWLC